VGDGYLIRNTVNVRFEVIWRDSAQRDTVLASAMNTFRQRPPGPNQSDAVAYETDMDGIAADARAGDRLVLKFSVVSGDDGGNYTPNGDGPLVGGRYPNLTLP
jgi:hypothetical protein